MTTVYMSHPSCLLHDPGPHHPERADRLRAIEKILEQDAFAKLERLEAPGMDRAAALRVHPVRYVDSIMAIRPDGRRIYLDADTAVSERSSEAIAHCVGAAAAAASMVMRGEAKNAFLAMRPPGHHAGMATPMGFCIFNTAAIAARHAQAAHGAGRVAVLDFDVHHGNGTQEIFWHDASVLYASSHQMPLYPGTGSRSERGEHGNIVNVPLAPGDGSAEFRAAWDAEILPRADAFCPDFIVISAGFDGHKHDPLGGLKLEESDYAWVTSRIMEIAEKHAKGRIVSVLEGGYDLEGLSKSAAAHLLALMAA
ncbi:MAG TPA: histone deacetylase family protein [Methylocella sp.]|nr:histone deacetylase family protein [Methylocella sp.]